MIIKGIVCYIKNKQDASVFFFFCQKLAWLNNLPLTTLNLKGILRESDNVYQNCCKCHRIIWLKIKIFFSFYTNKLFKMHCNLCTCLNWHYTQVTSTNFIVNTSEGFFFFLLLRANGHSKNHCFAWPRDKNIAFKSPDL